MIPCVSLVILNILLFSAMNEADQKRKKLLANKSIIHRSHHPFDLMKLQPLLTVRVRTNQMMTVMRSTRRRRRST